MHVLIVEDDDRVAHSVERALLLAGHQTHVIADGALAIEHVLSGRYDVVVLYVLLPSRNGFAVCREVRQCGNRTSILMLTARGAVSDRVNGLDAGADDDVSKPFATEELLARVRAVARRGTAVDGPLRVADLVLDSAARCAPWRS